jgi:hypothetical protein
MFCRKRERLIDIHLAIVSANADAAAEVAKLKGEGWSQPWWESVQKAREKSQETLSASQPASSPTRMLRQGKSSDRIYALAA